MTKRLLNREYKANKRPFLKRNRVSPGHQTLGDRRFDEGSVDRIS